MASNDFMESYLIIISVNANSIEEISLEVTFSNVLSKETRWQGGLLEDDVNRLDPIFIYSGLEVFPEDFLPLSDTPLL